MEISLSFIIYDVAVKKQFYKMNQAEMQYGICGRDIFLTPYFKTLHAADISKLGLDC